MKKLVLRFLLIFTVLATNTAFSLYQQARPLQSIEKDLRENPSNSTLLAELGDYYAGKDKWDDAASCFQACLRLTPDESKYYLKLADCLLQKNRPDLSYRVLTNAAASFERNPKVYDRLADTEYKLGLFSSALSNYQKAFELLNREDKNGSLHLGMAKALRELKQYDLSDKCFKTALQRKETSWGFFEYGKLLEETKRHREAVWAYRKALKYGVGLKEVFYDLLVHKLASAQFSYAMQLRDQGKKAESKKLLAMISGNEEYQKTSYPEKADFWLKRM